MDSLKEQAEELGISEVLEPNPGDLIIPKENEVDKKKSKKSPNYPKKEGKKSSGTGKFKELKHEIKERRRMEEQLNKLKDERKRKLGNR